QILARGFAWRNNRMAGGSRRRKPERGTQLLTPAGAKHRWGAVFPDDGAWPGAASVPAARSPEPRSRTSFHNQKALLVGIDGVNPLPPSRCDLVVPSLLGLADRASDRTA